LGYYLRPKNKDLVYEEFRNIINVRKQLVQIHREYNKWRQEHFNNYGNVATLNARWRELSEEKDKHKEVINQYKQKNKTKIIPKDLKQKDKDIDAKFKTIKEAYKEAREAYTKDPIKSEEREDAKFLLNEVISNIKKYDGRTLYSSNWVALRQEVSKAAGKPKNKIHHKHWRDHKKTTIISSCMPGKGSSAGISTTNINNNNVFQIFTGPRVKGPIKKGKNKCNKPCNGCIGCQQSYIKIRIG